MRAALRFFALPLAVGLGTARRLAQMAPGARAQPPAVVTGATAAQPPSGKNFAPQEIVDAGHHFFGTVSRGLAAVVEKATAQWGQPNGYILGEEACGAFIGGLRYGEGTLYTKNAGDLRVFWQGPTLGFDWGGDGARTMMLVYNLPAHRGDLSALRRHRRLGLFHRRLRHDGADRQRHRGGADPLRRGHAARRQYRLSEVHAAGDLEPVLSAARNFRRQRPSGRGRNAGLP